MRSDGVAQLRDVIDALNAHQNIGLHLLVELDVDLEGALQTSHQRFDFCVVGVATSGGRLTPGLRALMLQAIDAGMSVVNGLHEFLADDAGLAAAAERKGVTIRDVRRTARRTDLHFWDGSILTVGAPRIAVLGTDCALGKRTTARFLLEACRAAGIRTELVFTGQTGWMQGAPFGFIFDSVPNDFVSGELEHAIVSCWESARPDLILLEGQSALRNPAGPAGSEFILSGRAKGVILQHAPGRTHYEDLEEFDLRIPPVSDEIALIHTLGARTLAVTLNGEGMRPEALRAEQQRLRWGLGIPVVRPLEEGVEALVPVIREFIASEGKA